MTVSSVSIEGQMEVVFRTDASNEIGTGHVMRCLTLAEALRESGSSCRFVCRDHEGSLINDIRRRGFRADSLPLMPDDGAKASTAPDEARVHQKWLGASWDIDAHQTEAAIGGQETCWVVVDHYGIDSRWERELGSGSRRVLVIDDLADRKHDCHILVDQNWQDPDKSMSYSQLVPETCTCLVGPRYALLSNEYAQQRALQPPRTGTVERLLIFFGGSDPGNLTATALNALSKPRFQHLKLDVVIGVNHPDSESIRQAVGARAGGRAHAGLPSLAKLMGQADLMIGAGGVTTWERMCLGLPAIVVGVASNQTAISSRLDAAGFINYLGPADRVTEEEIAAAVDWSIANPPSLAAQSVSGMKLVPGDGTMAVCRAMESI